ncbi:Prion-like-(Q/N-rich)-domain-bearing protein [Caenorhabditis elegans]|uniref:Prion-like-(Q/N-rich)-domain-bearing protein n=1 Tax=Caenorhabditis elegans TaxID=6239 RepID=Q9XW82_CAEEL|nr:Prion-like-(Q/N-rich)-domain-bearing protein [Caenorhabditis elegans]CAA22087.2 Prion-like-(Q/N-rich)-domain-bearing protein [Caenorhabditis elegans]|eukprot:NP_499599.2 Prion-like-(Q/N-rich)-domain-bearing protein [Caenorhabditis elegans]
METPFIWDQNSQVSSNNMNIQQQQGTSFQPNWDYPAPQLDPLHQQNKQTYYQNDYQQNFQQNNSWQGQDQNYQQYQFTNLIASDQIQEIGQNFHKNTTMHDEFQKAQYNLIVDEPMDDGQQARDEGPLEPITSYFPAQFCQGTEDPVIQYGYTHPYTPCNNNNNNGNEYIPTYNYENEAPWAKLEPLTPILDVSPAASVQSKVDGNHKKEMAKKYSAKCLEKKNVALKEKMKDVELQSWEGKRLAKDIIENEQHLQTAVNVVLIPFLGDNNSNNFNISQEDVKQCFRRFVDGKKMISYETGQCMEGDEALRAQKEKVDVATENFEIAKKNNRNKKMMAKIEKVDEKTFATRQHRTKKIKETIDYEYQSMLLNYEVSKNCTITNLWTQCWNSLLPYVKTIINYNQDNLISFAQSRGQEKQLQQLIEKIMKESEQNENNFFPG